MSNSTNSRSLLSRSLVEWAISFVKQAGAPEESDTDRDGAFSHHAETHAAGMGIAAGWFATAQGQTELLSIVYAAAVYGRARATTGKRRRVLEDIVQEPHYALGGVVVGAVLGLAGNFVIGQGGAQAILDGIPV